MAPKHVAFILDGNRRFAKKLGLDPVKGHEYGGRKLLDIIGWLRDAGVAEATFYALSTENLKRSVFEVEALMQLFRMGLKRALADKKIDDQKVRVRFIGRLALLPKDIQLLMRQLEDKTMGYSGFVVNFAVAYGGRAEILDGVNRVLDEGLKSVDEAVFSRHLYLQSDVDLLIRPGGEKRLSNFLLWHVSYAELIFLDKLLPELTKEDILVCLSEYESRERRMGI